jgi:LPXTG-motif cell wall-anchored protein
VPLLRRRLLSLLSIAALAGGLAAPAAHAQGAGDEQYQDPFDSTGSQGSKPKPKPAPAAQAPSTSSGSTTAQAPATTPAPTPAPSATAATADPAAAGQLPRTGLDTRVALAAGLTLLLLGLALRRRTSADQR